MNITEKLFDIIEKSENISTQGYKILENNKSYTVIEVSMHDKYGQAMISYFYNMLCGQNQNGIATKEVPTLYYDNIKESYVLKMAVHPTIECMCNSYENFRKNYNTLIKDEISHLNKIL